MKNIIVFLFENFQGFFIYVLSRNMKNIIVFLFENFQFLEVKYSIYLNRLVFVMLQYPVSVLDIPCLYLAWKHISTWCGLSIKGPRM